MTTKKILFVITKSNWGGAQRYVYDLAANLPKNQFDVSVATGGQGPMIEALQSNGIRTISIPFLQRDIDLLKEILSLWALFKIFKKEHPDIIHLNSTKIGGLGALAAFAAKVWTKNYKQKTIFTAHGWGFNEDRFYIVKIIIFLAHWITVLLCDKIICVSYSVFHQGMYFPFTAPRLRFINLGIKEPEFMNRREARRALSTFNKTPLESAGFPAIGCIAELTKNKGIAYLIDAANHLKTRFADINFQLLIMGDGEDRKILEEKITQYGLEDKVHLLGFLPHASTYLKAFDIFVLPSITEAGAYALHEAGLAGLPVVATKVGGIPYIIEDGKHGFLVPKKNPDALASALKKLLESPELQKQMGKKNQANILQKFSFEKMLAETIDVYNKG